MRKKDTITPIRDNNYKRKIWEFYFEIFLLVSICVIHSINAGRYVNFYPVNGTFQNYNPVRRLFDGQIPYKDFQDYLGLGHLYTGALFTSIFGGDYRGSLIAFSFLTFGGLAILSFTIGLAIFRKKEMSLAVTNILLVTLLTQPFF